MSEDIIRKVAQDIVRTRGRSLDHPWGKTGWLWERVQPDQMFNTAGDDTDQGTIQQRRYMKIPAECGGESKQGGPAMKVEVWRNAHWFVHLSRDECVLCLSPDNMGSKDPDFAFPKMIWLSMRRTDRERATDRDWREMQRVKNDLVGPQHEACELYPAESRLVDAADQFHLWVFETEFPDCAFPFGYPKRDVQDTGDVEQTGGTQREIEKP